MGQPRVSFVIPLVRFRNHPAGRLVLVEQG